MKKKQRPFSTSPSSLQPSSAFVASGEKDQSLTHPPGHAKQSVQESNQGDSSTTRRFSEPSLKVQELPATERRASIDPSEALKRGRSFGPLLKAGTHQGSLKRSGKTSSLKTDVVGDGGEVTDSGKQDSVIDDPDTVGLTDETEESSDDYDDNDGDGARGRKRTLDGYDMSPESPTVTVTPPIGDKTTAKRFIVKPKTSFDHSVSRERPISPTQADIENLQEIRKAQNLGVAISTTDTPDSHKVIRTIIRGDYCYFQDQAKEENIRVRAYLLAINLRPEAAYATEWAIGTVLRDGDTLLAIFAVDKDAETGLPEDGLPVGEGGKAMQETTAEVDKMTAASQKSSRLLGMKNFLPRSRRSSVAAETRVSKSSKKQQERMHALEKLSDLCVDLLRKTKLQVRVVIEVIHCKVARSMLIEAVSSPSKIQFNPLDAHYQVDRCTPAYTCHSRIPWP